MFSSRTEAGQRLTTVLKRQKITADLVLGIPRGGVVVADVIAQIFQIPLDVLVVKKLGAPHNPELAIGAIAADDVTYIDEELARAVGADSDFIKQEIKNKHRELVEREKKLRAQLSPLEVTHKEVVLVDDGVATGATLLVGIEWLHKKKVKTIIVALPVVPRDTAQKIRRLVDRCVILEEPVSFAAVGEFYQDFSQVLDETVRELLVKDRTLP